MNTRKLGRYGEEAALRYLKKQGYRLVTCNFYCPYGELDLVMQQGRELVFVEVKTRTSQRFGAPEDSVNRQKLRKLRQTIAVYLEQVTLRYSSIRLDVVAVDLEPRTHRVLAVRHFQNIG